MKNNYYAGLLVAIMLCAFACKKSDKANGKTPSTSKPKYLVKTTIVETGPVRLGSVVTTSFITYTYDSKKRLSTMKSGITLTTYVYKDDGNLFSITTSPGSDAYRSYKEFTYDNSGKLLSYKLQGYQNNVLTTDITYTYVYAGGDKPTELHYEIYYEKFTYDGNGNLATVFLYGDPSYTVIYTYDNKKSMFVNAPFKYPLPGDNQRVSPNNMISNTTQGLNENFTTTINYVYDADGYPTAGTESIDYAYSSSYKYTYEYSTLE